MTKLRYRKIFPILSLLLVITFTPLIIHAQEETAAPEVTELPTVDVPTETAAPTEAMLPTDTTAPEVTEQPTDSPTAVIETAAPTEAVLPTATETVSTPGLPAEPALSLLVRELFDNGDVSAWTMPASWSLVPSEGGLALQVANSNETVHFHKFAFFNAAAQIRVWPNAGSVQLSLRESTVGSYTASLDTSGLVTLYRAGIVVQQTIITPLAGQWQTLRFSAIDNVLRVSVNGAEVIAVMDDSPLPPGTVGVSGSFVIPADGAPAPQNLLSVDDFFVWVLTTEIGLYPAPTPVVQSSSTVPPTVPPTVTPSSGKDYSTYPAPSQSQRVAAASTIGNNNFSGLVISAPYLVSDNTIGDDLEAGEPASTCGFGMSNTVWFSFTPAVTSNYVLSLAGSSFDTILAVYTGSAVNALTQVACNDDVSTSVLTSQLTLNLSTGSTYRIQVGGFNGRYGNYTLSVQQVGLPVPAVPTLVSPANAFKTDNTTQNLAWSDVANAVQYQVQWATNTAFTANVQSALVADPATDLNLPTLPDTAGTIYYWRVRALNVNSQASAYSAYRNFTLDTVDPNAPNLTAPAQNAITSSSRPVLKWTAVTGATAYLVDIDDNSDFSSLLVTDALATTTSYTPNPSLAQGTYYWRVQARDAALNVGAESSALPSPRAFTVNILTVPLNNAVIATVATTSAPVLKWAAVIGASEYTVQIDDENTFTLPRVVDVTLGNVTTYTAPALGKDNYFWRVIPTGFAPLANVFNQFTISDPALPAPVLVTPATAFKTDDTTQNLAWSDVANAVQYQVQWATNTAFTANVQSALVADPTTDLNLPTLPDTAGTIYYWRVRSLNSLGVAGAYSAYRNFTLDTVDPNAPNLTAPAQNAITSSSRPVLTWGAVTGATAYLVDIDDSSDFGSLIVTDALATTTSYTPNPSLPQGTYYWRVQARDAALNVGAESSALPSPRAFTVNILTAPLNNAVIATVATTSAPVLRWAAVIGASEYTVQIDDENTFTLPRVVDVTLGNVTTYTAPALGKDNYFWRVIPTGFAPLANVFNQFTISDPALPAPVLISPANAFKTDNTTQNLAWSDVANAVQYQVQWATNTAFTANVQSALVADPTTDLNLPTLPDTAGTIYYWRVRSLNSLGVAGAYSAYRNFTLDTVDPSAPNLTAPAQNAISSSSRPVLKWTAVTGATAYLVDIDDSSDFGSLIVTDALATTTSYTPNPSLPQGTYYWRVQARDAALNVGAESSALPSPRAFTLNILTAPLNNAVIATVATTSAPVLKWAAVIGASEYTVQIDDENTFTLPRVVDVTLGNVTTYTAPALGKDNYFWRVIPTGFAPLANVFNQFTISDPALPAPVLVTPANAFKTDNTTQNLAWSDVANAVQYQVQWATNTAFTANVQSALVADPTTDLNLPTLPDTAGTIYYWRVRSLNSLGVAGAYSAYRNFTLDTVDPLPPTLSSPANNTSTTTNPPTFTWVAPAGAAKYEIRYGTTNPPTIVVSNLTTTSFKPSSPLLLRNYYWQVRAFDAAGNDSGWSALRSVKIISATTAAPVLNRFTTSTPTLSWAPVSWTAPGGYYQVQADNNNTFASPEYVSANIPTGTQTVTTSALPNGTWYWRVRACTSTAACGAWSTTGTFTIEG